MRRNGFRIDVMRRTILLLACGAALIAASPTNDYPTYVKDKNLYAKNDFRGLKAPEFVVEQWLSGKAPDTKGKVVVIDFWATWCPPCRELIPEMNGWAAKFKDKVVFIGVSDEKAETVKEFMGKTKVAYPMAIDTKGRMKKDLDVQGIPHCIVISPDGVVRWQGWPQDPKDTLSEKILTQIVEASQVK